SFELRRHVDFAVADSEVDQRAGGKCQERFSGLTLRLRDTVEPILIDGVLHALGEVGLQLNGRDRYPVQKQHKVDAVLVLQRVADLPNDAKAIGVVAGENVRVQPEGRPELRHLQRLAQPDELYPTAQDIEGATLVQLFTKA